jgi:hypothetical protein
MKVLFLVFMLCPLSSWAQPKTEVHSNGVCSPAINGNVNTITVTCTGMSKETAADMVQLLNNILSRQLDPKKVYSQLDSISGTVADLNDTVSAVVNPLGNAPPEIVDKIRHLNQLRTDCFQFATQWSLSLMKGTSVGQAIPNATDAGSSAITAARVENDSQSSTKYATELGPRLIEWRSKIAPQMRLRLAQDWTVAKTSDQLQFICKNFSQLKRQYSVAAGADYALVKESQQLEQACQSLLVKWTYGPSLDPARLTAISQSASANVLTAQTEVINQQQVRQYNQTLLPRLTAAQDEILKLFPGDSRKNYTDVNDNQQMGVVCGDFGGLLVNYQMKLSQDLLKAKSQSRTRK